MNKYMYMIISYAKLMHNIKNIGSQENINNVIVCHLWLCAQYK